MRPRTGAAVFLPVLSTAGVLAATTAATAATASAATRPAFGHQDHDVIVPGDLLVSESHYTNDSNIVAGPTQLPPGCTDSNCVTAIANGDYPSVFNNVTVDANFGVTSRLYLQELTPDGRPAGVIPVP